MTVWSWPGSTVVRVIDGDSLVAQVTRDIGFHGSVTFQQKLRLNRINAPKLASPAGQIARSWLLAATTQPSPVKIDTVGAYKYGDEWMAEITLPDGRNVSDEMVKAGNAVYWDGQGPRPADG